MLPTRKNCLGFVNAAVLFLYIFGTFIKCSNTAFANSTADANLDTTSGLVKLTNEAEVKGNQSSSPTERLIIATNMTAARLKEQAEGPDADWKQNSDGKWEWKGKPRDRSKQSEKSAHRNLLKATQAPPFVNESSAFPSRAQEPNTTYNNVTDKINNIPTSASLKEIPSVIHNESSVIGANKSTPVAGISVHQNEPVLIKTNATNNEENVSLAATLNSSSNSSSSLMTNHTNVAVTENKTLSTPNVSQAQHILKAVVEAPHNTSFPMPVRRNELPGI